MTFISIYYRIGKLTERSNWRYCLPNATKLIQLHYVELLFVLLLEDLGLSACDAVLLDVSLCLLFKAEAVQFILLHSPPAQHKARTALQTANTHSPNNSEASNREGNLQSLVPTCLCLLL
jgi:hypothetical protein